MTDEHRRACPSCFKYGNPGWLPDYYSLGWRPCTRCGGDPMRSSGGTGLDLGTDEPEWFQKQPQPKPEGD